MAPQIEHSLGFRDAWQTFRNTPPASIIDLGSGGGIPGLVLAELWGCPTTLLDSMEKRCRSLEEYLTYPGAPKGASVVCGRAEELARSLEGRFELLTMRSFGPPAAAAECAVRFVQVGGLIIVSEPPDPASTTRWDESGLGKLKLRLVGFVEKQHRFVVLEKTGETASIYPRANGIPTKKLLWQ